MDCILLLVLVPAVLVGGQSYETSTGSNLNATTNAITPTLSTPTCEPRTTNKPTPPPLPPALGMISVQWKKPNSCQGYIHFSINFTSSSELLCHGALITKNLAIKFCKERRCGKFDSFRNKSGKGYMIHENLTVTTDHQCNTTFLTCQDEYNKELVAYKVITGLLLTLILLVLFCRFAQPTYIAVRKRFSQKRQNRWIGPTQSQSVSYHRGQASHPNNNTMKRHSYPGLERLTVNSSREPSSNRNSDYESYGG
ncbi:T-cell surface glycoprotein CD5 [Clarias gariepinus]|uniref:T-cell surface glycoprotein CD5 n=1 Tax=Clarias gariepinus TaxID=13013 RepID=UPI00234D0158|nr:T-cell surface glycoprotein CD5 [Clarias gariepinus]